MTREEAIAKTRAIAREKDWTWFEPVTVTCRRRWWLFGPRYWRVYTNSHCRGCRVWAYIDDESGTVTKFGFEPL